MGPFLKSGFPWHPDGDPTRTGQAFWEELFRRFAAAYQNLGVPTPEAQDAARRVREVALDPDNYRVRPDAASTLAVCAYKGWRNYILSNNYPELEQMLEALHLRPYFSGVVVSSVVGAVKPDPAIFRLAEGEARFPSLIWMVGDNPAADIAGAKNAGWQTIHLAQPGATSCNADLSVTELTQILKYL